MENFFNEWTGEIERLKKRIRILEIENRSSLANNLCSDHRDKQAGKSCLACEIERLSPNSSDKEIELSSFKKMSDIDLITDLLLIYNFKREGNYVVVRDELYLRLKQGRKAIQENINLRRTLNEKEEEENLWEDMEQGVENWKCCGNCFKYGNNECPRMINGLIPRTYSSFAYCNQWQSDKLTRKERESKCKNLKI